MALPIVTADERLAQRQGIKMIVLGEHGIGKTSLAWTLDAARTLLVNMEAGLLALEGWPGDTIDVRDWETARDLACWLGGVSPSRRPDEPYSKEHHAWVCQRLGDPERFLARYETLFFDSITELMRLVMQWARGQPRAFSEKTGRPDMRGVYALIAEETLGLLRHVQHCERNVVFVGGLRRDKDDYGRLLWEPMMEGAKTAREMLGVVDEIISMVELRQEDGTPYRAFVTQMLNPWGYPAKDRSGRLDLVEEPHLGRLMAKMRLPARKAPLVHALPAPAAPQTLSKT
jgi:hypothetical protein